MITQQKNRRRDRRLVSTEPWEVEYIHHQLPTHSHEEVAQAIQDCKRELHGSEDREKVMECVRRKIG